jgi:hypothetical protein
MAEISGDSVTASIEDLIDQGVRRGEVAAPFALTYR